DELCASFPTGGGRKSAAGINHLPKEQLSNFIQCFVEKYLYILQNTSDVKGSHICTNCKNTYKIDDSNAIRL
ncbi:MAG: hypothetical protein Q8O74_04065, partial [bacterium]|nr:hypothetical protein [bacterium]